MDDTIQLQADGVLIDGVRITRDEAIGRLTHKWEFAMALIGTLTMESQRFREHISMTTRATQIILDVGQWCQIPSGHWARVTQLDHLDGMALQVYGLDLAYPSADDWRQVGTIHALSDGLLDADDFTEMVWTRADLRLATPEEVEQLNQRTFGPRVRFPDKQ